MSTQKAAMNGFDIVMVIAVILFARLGVRLVTRYTQMKKKKKNASEDDTD
jgi:hypothetical protein